MCKFYYDMFFYSRKFLNILRRKLSWLGQKVIQRVTSIENLTIIILIVLSNFWFFFYKKTFSVKSLQVFFHSKRIASRINDAVAELSSLFR